MDEIAVYSSSVGQRRPNPILTNLSASCEVAKRKEGDKCFDAVARVNRL